MKNFLLSRLGRISRQLVGIQNVISLANWCHRLRHVRLAASDHATRRFQILLYHRVQPRNDPLSIHTVEAEYFERQIRILADCFRLITLPQLVEEVRGGALQPNTVCITFDDGYRDNYVYAYPILKKYGVPATIFLASGVIGSKARLWHDRVLGTLRITKVSRLNWPRQSQKLWRLDLREERVHFALWMLNTLKRQPPASRDGEIAALMAACQVTAADLPGNEMLSWHEVKEMHRHGFAFGAHTVTHPILSTLNEGEIVFEVSESKRMIEQQLGDKVKIFAYPNGQAGDFDYRAKKILQSLGYHCAVTTLWGMNSSSDDPFEWRRATPWEKDIDHFVARLVTLRMT